MSPNQGDSESPVQRFRAGNIKSKGQGGGGCLDKGVEHCSQGLELYTALLHSIQSGKVQIGLEVIRKPSCRRSGTHSRVHTHTEQRSRYCDLREAGPLLSSGSGALGGESPWSPHTPRQQ